MANMRIASTTLAVLTLVTVGYWDTSALIEATSNLAVRSRVKKERPWTRTQFKTTDYADDTDKTQR